MPINTASNRVDVWRVSEYGRLVIESPFRWNPFDILIYHRGFARYSFKGEISGFMSMLYGTQPKLLYIVSDYYTDIEDLVRFYRHQVWKWDVVIKEAKESQIFGYKVRAGLLDYSPFALGRALDQLGRRINGTTTPFNLSVAKYALFPITLPLYIVAKVLNIVKAITVGVITLLALPFLRIKYVSQGDKRKKWDFANHEIPFRMAHYPTRNLVNLPTVETLRNRFNTIANVQSPQHQYQEEDLSNSDLDQSREDSDSSIHTL